MLPTELQKKSEPLFVENWRYILHFSTIGTNGSVDYGAMISKMFLTTRLKPKNQQNNTKKSGNSLEIKAL